MKLLLSLVAAAAFLGVASPSVKAQDTASMDFFYDNLDPYGSWREVGDYGYCWQPHDVGDDWQPYSDGRWVYTDAGWTWDSNESFGWAVYHYGRWANVERHGWIWVPGTEWGPGWVSWRHSPRYVGWAPLPPEALFLRAIGFSMWVDDYYDIGPGNYRFVENRNFGEHRLNTVFIDRRQNLQIINQTTNITNISYINNVVHNGGLRYDQQARYSASPIQRYQLDRRLQFDGDPRRQSPEHLASRVRGTSLSVLALPFSDHSSAPPRRLAERVGRAELNHGWKNAGSPAEIAAMRERLKSPSQVPEQLPPQPRFERPEASRPQRMEETIRKPADQPPPTPPRRDDSPRNPNTPPMAPGTRPQDRERPPASAPGAGRESMPAPQRPADSPNPGGRNKVSEPSRPGGENVMPPKVERPAEKPNLVPPQQRMQPRPPENTPQRPGRPETSPPAPRPETQPDLKRPETPRPTPRPEAPPTSQRPENRKPGPGSRPQAVPAPQTSPQRQLPQSPAIRPVPAAPQPVMPKPPQVRPSLPSSPMPPTVQPTPARERPQGGDRPGQERKKRPESPQ